MEHVKGPDMNREAEITRLVEAYQGDLLRMCCTYLKDRALAEDAVQETFVKAYRSLTDFRRDSSEKTWLMRIAVNTCKDVRRSAWFRHLDRRITPEELPEAPCPEQDGEDGALMDEILRLPPRYKDVILLYYYESMDEREIASALGIAVSTVSTRLNKARKKLRLTLKGGR